MENEPKRPTRRSRRKKQPVEVVKDAPTVDAAELEAKGFEKKRARDEKGHFVKDDPSTPENEAFEWVKPIGKEEPVIQAVQKPVASPIVEPAPQPTKPDPEEAPEPWKKRVRPMKKKKPSGPPRGLRNR